MSKESEKFTGIFENGTTQSRSCFRCQKKYQYHLTEILVKRSRKEFNSHWNGLGHQHGRCFIVLRHQYDARDRLSSPLFRSVILTLWAIRLISIKFLLVISMLWKTEWSWELQTWSHMMNLLVILSPSPHHFCGKWKGATNENSNFDLRVLRVKGYFSE